MTVSSIARVNRCPRLRSRCTRRSSCIASTLTSSAASTRVPYTEARQRDVQSWISSISPELAKQQDRGDSTLWTLHVLLEDSERLVKKQGFLFEGEITRNEEIHQRRCSSGRERKPEYRVDQVLWDYPDSLLRPGYKISKGFIDCRESSMPNWPPETRVLVYCEASPGEGYSCLAHVMFTDDRLFRVKQWIAELRIQEGNPELLKMHFLLRDSLELSPSRPLLVLGKVTWVTPKQQFGIIHSTAMVPTMRLAISRLIWGYYERIGGRSGLPAPRLLQCCCGRECDRLLRTDGRRLLAAAGGLPGG